MDFILVALAVLTFSSATAVTPQSDTNTEPFANAGIDQKIPVGGFVVTLNGTGSYDPDGDNLSYLWSFISVPDGSNLTMPVWPVPTYVNVNFTPDIVGLYVAQLEVSDDWETSTDTVEIEIYTDPEVEFRGKALEMFQKMGSKKKIIDQCQDFIPFLDCVVDQFKEKYKNAKWAR